MDKYDRQVRIWGLHGQAQLEQANICIVGATAASSEALKGLVLAGIGRFTLYDPTPSSLKDEETNYFHLHRTGARRAECVLDNVARLNDETDGIVVDSVEELLSRACDFTLFIVVDGLLPEEDFDRLASELWRNHVPMFLLYCRNSLGLLMPFIRELCVYDTHHEFDYGCLRLDKPFDELRALERASFADSEKSKIPWPLVVLHYMPANNLKELQARLKESGSSPNYEEAVRHAARSAFVSHGQTVQVLDRAPEEVQRERPPSPVARRNHLFWTLALALRRFIDENNGCLPVRPSLPDMQSQSDLYLRLRNVYSRRAAQDLERMMSLLGDVDADVVKQFCHNCSHLTVVATRSWNEVKEAACEREDAPLVYCINEAMRRFKTRWNREPVASKNDEAFVYSELMRLPAMHGRQRRPPGLVTNVDDKYLTKDEEALVDMMISGASNHYAMPVVASWIGNAAAHEAIKVITGQFVVSHRALLFNGNECRTDTF